LKERAKLGKERKRF